MAVIKRTSEWPADPFRADGLNFAGLGKSQGGPPASADSSRRARRGTNCRRPPISPDRACPVRAGEASAHVTGTARLQERVLWECRCNSRQQRDATDGRRRRESDGRPLLCRCPFRRGSTLWPGCVRRSRFARATRGWRRSAPTSSILGADPSVIFIHAATSLRGLPVSFHTTL